MSTMVGPASDSQQSATTQPKMPSRPLDTAALGTIIFSTIALESLFKTSHVVPGILTGMGLGPNASRQAHKIM